MKELVLKESHIAMGGKMIEFAGFNMPVTFSGLIEEHNTVRNGVGVFDVSHMGEFFVRGPKAFELVQKITSNNVATLFDGKVLYSTMPNGKGGIVDDLLVYRVNEEEYLLVVNGANVDKDWSWVNEQNTMGAELSNESDDYCLFAVQGPKASEAMQSLTEINLKDMVYYTFEIGTFAGVENVIVSATGYTGSGGFEIYVKNADAKTVFDAIFKAGEPQGIQPIGLGARDTLRLEKGFCLYGNDIDDTTSPLEAGLGWVTKFVEGNDFIDREFLANQKEEGLTRRLVGFEMEEKGIPRHGYDILDMDGNKIGQVTSGTQSPSLNKAIGMGYVNVPHHKKGSEIRIQIRKKSPKAVVVGIPFLK
ncbi:glycine cleavage system aminomethyltransferase GcvT [bacterium SCSIO 12643]|nr:glycine cleavage system aminomethyltransferase GcvT [bacterium SCSIO 12643]